jgi:hypothetical protein
MRIRRGIGIVSLLTVSMVLAAQTVNQPSGHGLKHHGKAVEVMIAGQGSDDVNKVVEETDLLEKSREAGLLTDWHLAGRFGHGGENEFMRKFAPEHEAMKQATHRFVRRQYELVFPSGTFTLPEGLDSLKGVFYANSSTYLTSGGDWNVYLESGAEAMVFVDGRRVVVRGARATGALRGKIHVDSGYHSVLVKFTAHSAPFRVAILPPNSGSRRKNNTPYLQASPASEDMLARLTKPPADGL